MPDVASLPLRRMSLMNSNFIIYMSKIFVQNHLQTSYELKKRKGKKIQPK